MACSACSKRKQAVKRPTTSSNTQNTAAKKAEPLRAKVRYTGR